MYTLGLFLLYTGLSQAQVPNIALPTPVAAAGTTTAAPNGLGLGAAATVGVGAQVGPVSLGLSE